MAPHVKAEIIPMTTKETITQALQLKRYRPELVNPQKVPAKKGGVFAPSSNLSRDPWRFVEPFCLASLDNGYSGPSCIASTPHALASLGFAVAELR